MASVKKENKIICANCDKMVVPIIKFEKVTQIIRDTTFNYIELSAHCPICDEEIYMKEVNDANVVSRYNGFIAAKPVVRGKWILDAYTWQYHCSRCGALAPTLWDGIDEYIYTSDFCLNCGADMRKEANDGR